MRSGNAVESLSAALYKAILCDLPEVEYVHQTPQERRENLPGVMKKRRPYDDEVEVYHFPQTWGSTTLGFGGIGGQAMTTAYTTVVVCDSHAAVYFAGGHAYTKLVTAELAEDLSRHRMASVRDSVKYDNK